MHLCVYACFSHSILFESKGCGTFSLLSQILLYENATIGLASLLLMYIRVGHAILLGTVLRILKDFL